MIFLVRVFVCFISFVFLSIILVADSGGEYCG